ncbi:hypothetical protein EC991_009793 [Linnemannia zychae]|nr:hypothetical protein EC991_009793 [Linnemannia zychae]
MRPPLSEISTANILSSSTTLISSDIIQQQQQQQTGCSSQPLASSSHSHFNNNNNHITTISRINPNQGNNIEDEAKQHLHDRARFVASTEPPSMSFPSASELVTTTSISPTISNGNNNNDNALAALANGLHRLGDQPSQRTILHSQGVTSPLLDALTPPASASASASIMTQTTAKSKGDKMSTRARLSRDAKVIKSRIRRLWMDPTQEDHSRMRRDPKNQYLLLEESLTGILQIVPPIIENARIPQSSPMGLSYPTPYSNSPGNHHHHDHPRAMPMSMDFSAATGSIFSNSSSLNSFPALIPTTSPPTPSLIGSAPSKSSGRSTNNSLTTTATGPVHTRARTTSSNSTSTISATRYQIATSMLQPPEPPLTDIVQPTLQSPISGASLGEPSLSAIAAAAAVASAVPSPTPSSSFPTETRPTASRMAKSNEILISKLLSLSNTFTAAIRALCEQQNEKVLRFDDDMILELLTRWEQEAGKEEEEEEDEPVSDHDNASTTSLVTLGATNALERYQIIVGRVWEETDVILSCIRKIRDLVEFGRIQHYSDFDDDDSEEDAIEKDEIIKKSLYSRLLFHANGLVTVLGELLECVSGIQRLVSTIKTQRKSQEDSRDELYLDGTLEANGQEGGDQQLPSVVDFIEEEPRPVKHLDPVLMRKLKRKTRFKKITEKVRRSFSDFAKRSTSSLLSVFPPLGDGTNEGFHWDSYSDGEYYSEEWVGGTEFGSSLQGDEDSYSRTLSPPESPGIKSENFFVRHRRLSSKDSAGLPEQYWPGSTRLGFSDDGISPTNSIHPASPLNASSSSIPIVSSSGNGAGFVGGTSIVMSRSMSSEQTVNTIATRLHIGSSPNNVNNAVSPTRTSFESLRESTQLTGTSSVGADPLSMAISLPPTSPIKSDNKEKRQSLLFRRKSIQAPTFTGVSISAPVPIASRPYSAYSSSSSEFQASPSRNNYRARPPRPPNPLPPMPPSPTPGATSSSGSDSFEASNNGSDSIGSISVQSRPFNSRAGSYLATRSISPLQNSPLILDSPFTRQTSIRMGNDRNRYSVKMPEDYHSDDHHHGHSQLSRSNTNSSMNGSIGSHNSNSPRSSNFPGSFWRRRSYNDALETNWQSLSIATEGSSDSSMPPTPSTAGRDYRSTFGLDSTGSQSSSSVRVTSFEFTIPFFSKDGNALSPTLASYRQGSRPGLGSGSGMGSSFSRNGSERAMMMTAGNHRRHSSPLTLGAERALADALSRRPSTTLQQQGTRQSTSNSQQMEQHQAQSQPGGSGNRNSVHIALSAVGEKSKPGNTSPQRQQNQYESPTYTKVPLSTQNAAAPQPSDPSEVLRIPPRPRPTYRKAISQEATTTLRSFSNNVPSHQHGSSASTSAGNSPAARTFAENGSNGHREPRAEATESRIPVDPARKPVTSPRFGDMRKAWEILNLDVKRLNQYSHMRAYAKAQTAQDNLWALNHPNALRSTTSPRVLHICENGTDVLVMEMFAGHLQVVAGLLEKLIERLADENAQDAEYVNCFLLSHSFFIDSEDLLDRLIARFHIQPHQGEILYFEKWQTIIQVKILCVLQRWILIQYEDFELNANLLKTLRKFLEVDVRQAGFIMESECIEKNISIKSLSPIKNCSVIMEQGRFCLQRSRTRKISLSRSLNNSSGQASSITTSTASSRLDPVPASPIEQMIEYGPTPELATTSPILQLNGQDLARYLTLADMKAFRSITVFELMSGWWKRRQAAENKRVSVSTVGEDGMEPKSPSGLSVVEVDGAEDGAIEAFTRRANMLSYWVAHEIVSTAGSKTRKQLIKKFIEVAKICRNLNNLHTSMFIISALTSKPVRRLSSTWKLVSSRDMETLKGLEALMDPSGNMRCYRQAIAEAEAPTIPFLPILLKDITFILDGNPTMIASKANLTTQQPAPSTTPPGLSSSACISAPLPNITTDSPTTPTASSSTPPPKDTAPPLVNFDKFRRLTQYVENAVDMAKSVDYSFEHQLLRQARVFRPSSPSLNGGENDSLHGHSGGGGGGGSSLLDKFGNMSIINHSNGPVPDGSRGALDHISEMVERRLVKASGLYGVQQRVIQVEFVNRAPSSKSSGGTSSLWKSSGGDGGVGSNNGSTHGSIFGGGNGAGSDMVIRAVQGEEDYLIGLSRMCEPARW